MSHAPQLQPSLLDVAGGAIVIDKLKSHDMIKSTYVVAKSQSIQGLQSWKTLYYIALELGS